MPNPLIPFVNRMAVMHTLSPTRLKEMKELGWRGMPSPSLAVMRPARRSPFDFGDVGLVGRPHLAEPSETNPIHASDIFSPRVPTINQDPERPATRYFTRQRRSPSGSVLLDRVPPTLENVVEHMRSQPLIGGEYGASGAFNPRTPTFNSYRALTAPRFNTMQDLLGARSGLASTEHEYMGAQERNRSEHDLLASKLFPHRADPTQFGRAWDMLAAAMLDRSRNGGASFDQFYRGVPDELMERLNAHQTRMDTAPELFYEAKPQRAVGMDEFAGALVPQHMEKELTPLLRDQGVSNIVPYSYHGSDESKANAVTENFGEHLFARGGRAPRAGGGKAVRSALRMLGQLYPEGAPGFEAVKHMPETIKLPGIGRVQSRPIEPIQGVANEYMRARGLGAKPLEFVPINPEYSKRVAGAYADMPHDPRDPAVKRSYDALIEETMDQLRAAKPLGIKYQFIKPGQSDPYALSPALGYADLLKNRRLSVFPTEAGFGTLNEAGADNPLLRPVGRIGDLRDATANDAFRIVHDLYGHYGPGNAHFRAPGEERAFQLHSRMYSPEALPAAASETRGQNSWVNFGPHAEQNATASGADTIYADQKTGIMPAWAYQLPPEEGADVDAYIKGFAKGGHVERAMRTIRKGFEDGGMPGDDASAFVQEQLHPAPQPSALVDQMSGPTAAAVMETDRDRPMSDASAFVRHQLGKTTDPQLPQMDREAYDAMKYGAVDALHNLAYFSPAAPAAGAYDLYKGLESGDPTEVAMSSLGLPGRAAKAGAMAMSAMMPSDAQAGVLSKILKPIRAYHGSPHKFDKFDISRIGTGEGAQAFGHGLYFAGAEPTAQSYRYIDARINPDEVRYGGRSIQSNYDAALRAQELAHRAKDPKAISDANARASFWESMMVGNHPDQVISDSLDPKHEWPGLNRYASSISRDKFSGIAPAGHMYEVNLHVNPEHLLDWDAPIAKQSPIIQEFTRSIKPANTNTRSGALVRKFQEGNEQFDYPLTGAQLLTNLERAHSSPQVSGRLNEAGIPGIKYLDAGSRDAGEGTHNYVMFSHYPVEILRRYARGGFSRKTGGKVKGALRLAHKLASKG